MQAHVPHRYVAELRLDGGQVVTTPALAVDWGPAVEWGHFMQVRRGEASLASVPARALVRPRWDEDSGPPYVAALEVSSCKPGSRAAPCELGRSFLVEPVRRAVSSLVEAGQLAEGATYTWQLCAFESDRADPDGPQGAFAVRELPGDSAEAFATSALADLLRRAEHHGPTRREGEPGNFPVLVARAVLVEAAAAASAAGDLESGGILLGRVSRDSRSRDLVVEISAQVPASEAIADDASLRFTPQTWQAVHAAIRLRRSNERIVGWWHSHPRKVWPCHACPAERRERCPSYRAAFFSSMDVAFHRTAFPGPINVALLFSFHDVPQPRHDLFGWWQGAIAAREYYVP